MNPCCCRNIFFLFLAFLISPIILADQDGKEVKIDFRGAFYSGEFAIKPEENGIATALNAIKFGPENTAQFISDKPRKTVFKESSKKVELFSPDSFLQWLALTQSKNSDSALPKFALKHLSNAEVNNLKSLHRQIFDSLLVDTPIILAIDTFAVECKNGSTECFWQWQERQFVLIARVEPMRKDYKKSISLLLLNPLEKNAALVDAHIIYRKGSSKKQTVNGSPETRKIDFTKPFLTIHGNNIDNLNKVSWAQKTVTIPVWMIGRFMLKWK